MGCENGQQSEAAPCQIDNSTTLFHTIDSEESIMKAIFEIKS